MEFSDRERKTLVVAMMLYWSTLKRERDLVEEVATIQGLSVDELITDRDSAIVPLIARLSYPDWLAKQRPH